MCFSMLKIPPILRKCKLKEGMGVCVSRPMYFLYQNLMCKNVIQRIRINRQGKIFTTFYCSTTLQVSRSAIKDCSITNIFCHHVIIVLQKITPFITGSLAGVCILTHRPCKCNIQYTMHAIFREKHSQPLRCSYL